MKDLIFNSTMVKDDFSELKRKTKCIDKQRRHTNFFYKSYNFLIQKISYFINIFVKCIFWQI